jgi:hypothetical protein
VGSVDTSRFDPGRTVGFESGWGFHSPIGAMYLQMMWLMTEGGDAPRCNGPGCPKIIRIGEYEPRDAEYVSEKVKQGDRPRRYKTRKDKEFCSRNCKEKLALSQCHQAPKSGLARLVALHHLTPLRHHRGRNTPQWCASRGRKNGLSRPAVIFGCPLLPSSTVGRSSFLGSVRARNASACRPTGYCVVSGGSAFSSHLPRRPLSAHSGA